MFYKNPCTCTLDESDHQRLTREIRGICGYLSLPADIVSLMPLDNSEQKSSFAFASVVERFGTVIVIVAPAVVVAVVFAAVAVARIKIKEL